MVETKAFFSQLQILGCGDGGGEGEKDVCEFVEDVEYGGDEYCCRQLEWQSMKR